MIAYTCVVCGKGFTKDRKLRTDAIERCDNCYNAERRRSRRETWAKHGEQYRATQKAKPKPEVKRTQERDEPEVEVQPEVESDGSPESSGKPVNIMLPNGHKVVWLGNLH